MTAVPRAELDRRLAALRDRMQASDPPSNPQIDAALVIQNVDLYYLSGTMQTAHLLVPAAAEPRLLVRQVLDRAREDSALDDVRPMKSLRELRGHLEETCGSGPWRVGMELDVVPAATVSLYAKVLGDGVEIVDVSRAILACRAAKSEWEIGELRRSAEIQCELLATIGEYLAGDVSTYDLTALLDGRSRLLGHCGAIRLRGLNAECGIGVIVSGEAGAVPGHSVFPIGGAGTHAAAPGGGVREKIADDTPVIIDYLVNATGYHADCTRMAVRGTFPDEAAEILDAMHRAMRFAEEYVRAGVAPSAVYDALIEFAADAGYADGFMGRPGFQVRFVGHSVGLEVDEAPVLAPRFDEPLVVGNTLAIEPKFTHPRFGVVGLENTYAVREDGIELLTTFPEDVVVV